MRLRWNLNGGSFVFFEVIMIIEVFIVCKIFFLCVIVVEVYIIWNCWLVD